MPYEALSGSRPERMRVTPSTQAPLPHAGEGLSLSRVCEDEEPRLLGRLRLRIDPNGDGRLRLVVRAQGGEFSGVSSAVFDAGELRAFAAELDRFPLPPDGARLQGDYWGRDRPGEEPHVTLAARQVEARGAIRIRVLLTTAPFHADSDRQSRVALGIPTDYAAVQRLARDLGRLVAGKVDEAVLETWH
jgi:hypothetical protein